MSMNPNPSGSRSGPIGGIAPVGGIAPPPVVASVASITSKTSSSVTVGATAATGGTPPFTYQWQRSTNSGSTWANISGATTRAYTDTGRSAATRYDYRIIATDAAGIAKTSNAVNATTDP